MDPMNDTPTIYDNALHPSKNMYAGNKKFQLRARRALPILVQQALHSRTDSVQKPC